MTVKMCVKYPQQLREDGIGLIKRREMWNQRQPVVKKPQSMLGRHSNTVKHPYLINNNAEAVARIRKVHILFNFLFFITNTAGKKARVFGLQSGLV
jgi:hypothetical protein